MSENGWVDPTDPHPECDHMSASMDSNDARAWRTLAEKLERKARFFQNENHMRAESLRRYHDLIGYNNDDGFHSEPGPEEMLRALIDRANRLEAEDREETLDSIARFLPGGGDNTLTWRQVIQERDELLRESTVIAYKKLEVYAAEMRAALQSVHAATGWRLSPSPSGFHYVEHVAMQRINEVIDAALKATAKNPNPAGHPSPEASTEPGKEASGAGRAGTPEALARKFHETYERLALDRGYATRPESREFSPFTENGSLMVAVCRELLRSGVALT